MPRGKKNRALVEQKLNTTQPEEETTTTPTTTITSADPVTSQEEKMDTNDAGIDKLTLLIQQLIQLQITDKRDQQYIQFQQQQERKEQQELMKALLKQQQQPQEKHYDDNNEEEKYDIYDEPEIESKIEED